MNEYKGFFVMILDGFSAGIVGLISGLMMYPEKLGWVLIGQYTITALLASGFAYQYTHHSDSEFVQEFSFWIGLASAFSSIFIAKGIIVILQKFSKAPLNTIKDLKK